MQTVLVSIEQPLSDATRLEELSLSLRSELLETDVVDVRRVRSGAAPPGSRAPDASEIAALMVAVPASVQAVASLVTTIRGWLSRAPTDSSVSLTIGDRSLTLGASEAVEREKLISAFMGAVEADLG